MKYLDFLDENKVIFRRFTLWLFPIFLASCGGLERPDPGPGPNDEEVFPPFIGWNFNYKSNPQMMYGTGYRNSGYHSDVIPSAPVLNNIKVCYTTDGSAPSISNTGVCIKGTHERPAEIKCDKYELRTGKAVKHMRAQLIWPVQDDPDRTFVKRSYSAKYNLDCRRARPDSPLYDVTPGYTTGFLKNVEVVDNVPFVPSELKFINVEFNKRESSSHSPADCIGSHQKFKYVIDGRDVSEEQFSLAAEILKAAFNTGAKVHIKGLGTCSGEGRGKPMEDIGLIEIQ